MKDTLTEMKTKLQEVNNRVHEAENQIRDLEYKEQKTPNQSRKRIPKNECKEPLKQRQADEHL